MCSAVDYAIRFVEGHVRVAGNEGVEHVLDNALGAGEEVFSGHDGCVLNW